MFIDQSQRQTSRVDRGRRGFQAGLAAEDIVERDYARRGIPACARRWRGQGGEIDLVLRDGDELVFVEVKTSRTFDSAARHLTARQAARILAAAAEFAGTEPLGELTPMRVDIALVDQTGQVRILENAIGHD